jgi:predicted phosphodiesterase
MHHRVGVIADTHIPTFPALPQAVWQHFAGVELIIHARDLSILSVCSIQYVETIAARSYYAERLYLNTISLSPQQ